MAMINEVRRLIEEAPFAPFVIFTSSGKSYRVASVDHIDIAPSGNRLVVWHDDDTCSFVGSLHITSVDVEEPSGQRPA